MSPEREDKVRQALKQLDSLLDIKWLPYCRIRNGRPEGRYALICKWPQADKRWEMYRSGEIGEPFDIMGYFEGSDGEMDWFNGGQNRAEPVDPDAVMDRTLELLGKCDNSKESWKRRMKDAAAKNKALREKRRKEVLDETLQGAKHYRRKVQGIPLIQGEDLDDARDS